MSKRHGRFIKIAAGALAVLGLGIGAAEAIDLRSWDQKINDPDRRFVVLPAFNNEAVLDKETQLVWQRTPATGLRTYDQAVRDCIISFTEWAHRLAPSHGPRAGYVVRPVPGP